MVAMTWTSASEYLKSAGVCISAAKEKIATWPPYAKMMFVRARALCERKPDVIQKGKDDTHR